MLIQHVCYCFLTKAFIIKSDSETNPYLAGGQIIVIIAVVLPCQKMKFLDSAWHADMGGWWLT